jgi:hypothetical protein
MVRRSTPQRTVDDRAFPIRIKVAPVDRGFGPLASDTVMWLQDNLPRSDWANHSVGHHMLSAATCFYFRHMEDAQRFLEQFPKLRLADCSPAADEARHRALT